MASNIKFKRSAVQNRVPTTSQLDLGELALNTYDGKLYTEINTGSAAVVEIGSILSSLVVDGANGGGGGDVTFHGTTAGRDLLWDYSANQLVFANDTEIKFGVNASNTDRPLFIKYQNSNTRNQVTGKYIDFNVSDARFKNIDNGNHIAKFFHSKVVLCDANGNDRLETTADGADIFGTGSLKIPVGTTAQRSGSPTAGDLRYNSTTSSFEGYSSAWGDIGAGGIGVGSDASNPRTGIIQNRVGVGFTDLNIVGAGISVTGYGTTVFVDFNEFKPGAFHRTIHNYTATAGQTTFAGLNYAISEKQIAVYLNGARQSEATYTATSGTTVVLDVGASVGDEVEIVNIHTSTDVDRKVNTYTATAGQTTFTGLSYNSKQELDVYLNGIRLASDDFTATSGNTVVLAVGASVNDIVDIVSTGDGISFRSTSDASGDRFTLNNLGIGQATTPNALNVTGNSSFVGVATVTGNTFIGGNLTISNTAPQLTIHDTNHSPNYYYLKGNAGALQIEDSSNGNRFLFNANGSNSIFGTTVFSGGVQVSSNLGVDGDILIPDDIVHTGDTDTKIRFPAADQFSVETGGSTRLSVTNTGASVTGNLAVSGVLTYDDVTNVDSVGIITARAGIVVSGGTVTIPTVAGTNTNAFLNVLFQTAAGVIDGGSALTYNPAQDVLSVNGNHISSQTFRGDGALGTLTCDNHSSTTSVNVSNTIDISTVDNATDAFTLKQGSNEYITVDTNNSSELITLGNTTTNPKTIILGGNFGVGDNNPDTRLSVTAASGTDVVGKFTSTDANAWIQFRDNTTTDTAVMVGANGDDLLFRAGSNTRWKIDSSGHLLPNTAGAVNIGSRSVGIGSVFLPDDKRIAIGNDEDLQISHSGGVNFLLSPNNRQLQLKGDGGLLIRAGGNQLIANFLQSAVTLYHNVGNLATARLTTTSTGITVGGEVAATQDYPTLQPTLDINFANTKSLDPRINYVRTGTASYLNEFGKIAFVGENEPRFDHDPTTLEPKGLLIEESRQNMFRATADMGSNAGAWPVGGARGRRGVNVEGPDGKMTALQNIYLGTSGDLNIYYETANGATEMTTTNSTVYTFSVFAKAAAGNSYINGIRLRAFNPNRSVSFNVVNGTVGATNEGSSSISSKTIVEYPNGWYRCIMTFTSGTDGNQGFQIYVENEGGNAASLNSSSANGEAMYFWGAQLEIGGFATSFIPTQSRDGRNLGRQTTRGLDIVTIDKHDIDGIFNPEEGTMFYEASVTNLTNDNQPIVAFRDVSNTAASYHAMGHAIGGSLGSVRTWAKNTAGSNIHITAHTGLVADTFYKHMYGYKYNDYSDAFGQGTTLKQENSTSGNHAMLAAGVIDELRFGGYYASPEGTYTLDSGHIRRFSYWPKKLTNTQIKTYVS